MFDRQNAGEGMCTHRVYGGETLRTLPVFCFYIDPRVNGNEGRAHKNINRWVSGALDRETLA